MDSTGSKLSRSSASRKSKSSSNKQKAHTHREAWMWSNTGEPMMIIRADELRAGSTLISSAEGFESLCTYNWVLTKSPTIYVPGAPPRWKPLDLPVQLKKDCSTQFDRSDYGLPKYSFEPIFRALSIMNPTVSFHNVDIVSNRNSLRHLLGFIKGRLNQSFRIDLDLVHNTLFLTRREKNHKAIIHGSFSRGFGHNFEQEFTEKDKDLASSSHHRVIRYALGDLICAVRFEVDAYDDTGDNLKATDTTKVGTESEYGDALASFAQISLDKPDQKEKVGVNAVSRGRITPSSTLYEIKTVKKASMAKILPQMWFGRIPYLCIAKHDDGIFKEIRIIDAAARFPDWEEKEQTELRKLACLLSKIRDKIKNARTSGVTACAAICDHRSKPLKLELYISTSNKGVLPAELVERYWPMRT